MDGDIAEPRNRPSTVKLTREEYELLTRRAARMRITFADMARGEGLNYHLAEERAHVVEDLDDDPDADI